jgi:hypothetical protein
MDPADRPEPTPYWRWADMAPTERRVHDTDALFLRLAELLAGYDVAPGDALTELLFLLADAATKHDMDALEAIYDSVRSLRAQVPDGDKWAQWRGRLETAQQLAWLAHFSLWEEPL